MTPGFCDTCKWRSPERVKACSICRNRNSPKYQTYVLCMDTCSCYEGWKGS